MMVMTERKPRQQSFTSWIDQQIADAENRGVFENLPGAGKPLNIKPTGDGDFGQAWVRDYARREGVTPDEFLPTPLKLRREIEQLTETVGRCARRPRCERPSATSTGGSSSGAASRSGRRFTCGW